MELWQVSTSDGILLGEVEAEDSVEAVFLAADRWPEQLDNMLVRNKDWFEGLRRKEENEFRRIRSATAYHEAGHAVLARHLGLRVRRVAIGVRMNQSRGRFDPDAVSYGQFEYYIDSDLNEEIGWREIHMRKIIMILGGPMAEYRYQGNRDWALLEQWSRDGSDFDRVQWLARRGAIDECGCTHWEAPISGRDRHARCAKGFLKAAQERAARELDAVWPGVEIVAVELERRRELNGADIDGLLSGGGQIGGRDDQRRNSLDRSRPRATGSRRGSASRRGR